MKSGCRTATGASPAGHSGKEPPPQSQPENARDRLCRAASAELASNEPADCLLADMRLTYGFIHSRSRWLRSSTSRLYQRERSSPERNLPRISRVAFSMNADA